MERLQGPTERPNRLGKRPEGWSRQGEVGVAVGRIPMVLSSFTESLVVDWRMRG